MNSASEVTVMRTHIRRQIADHFRLRSDAITWRRLVDLKARKAQIVGLIVTSISSLMFFLLCDIWDVIAAGLLGFLWAYPAQVIRHWLNLLFGVVE